MTLSIVTINYNNLEGLRKTIDSVLSQTWHDFEWIIIDGGSTDGSKELIEETANKLAASDFNPLSYWCSEPDKGIYNALNKGITHCKGEYINCMNSGDEFYLPNTLYNVFNKQHSSAIIYGNHILSLNSVDQRVITYPNQIGLLYLYNTNLCHQSIFVKTSILKQKGFDERYKICADYAKWLELIYNGYDFEYTNNIICRFDGNGLTFNDIDTRKKEELRLRSSIIPKSVRNIIMSYNKSIQESSSYMLYSKDILNNGGFSASLLCLTIDIINFIGKLKKIINEK